ncbi:hypothetical protein [Methanogenium cariaci]|nr:hypothetical protein [Methanogenium cariaci]
MVTRLRRYSQIADILIKYGFGIALEQVDPGERPAPVLSEESPR